MTFSADSFSQILAGDQIKAFERERFVRLFVFVMLVVDVVLGVGERGLVDKFNGSSSSCSM